jgi:hypothetical protein
MWSFRWREPWDVKAEIAEGGPAFKALPIDHTSVTVNRRGVPTPIGGLSY